MARRTSRDALTDRDASDPVPAAVAGALAGAFDPDLLRDSMRILDVAGAVAARPVAGQPAAGAHDDSPLAAYLQHYDLLVPVDVEHRFGRIDVQGTVIAVHLFLPPAPRGSLVAVHGLFDHAALWRHQLRWALGRGLAVCLFDLPGHGLSSGDRAHIDDFLHYVTALEAVLDHAGALLPAPRIGLGQSTGCSVLMQAVLDPTRPDPGLDDLVLLAPLVRPVGDRIGRPLVPLLAPFIRQLPRAFYGNTSDPGFNRFQRDRDLLQARALPVTWVRAMARWSRDFDRLPRSALSPCIVQGTLDTTVDWKRNLQRLRQRFTTPEEVMLEGALHNLMNEAPIHRQRIETVLDARLDQLLGAAPGGP